MVTRKGLGKGLGKGYKNLKPTFMHDKRVHSTSAKGIRQPQRMPAMLKLARRKAVSKLRKGLRRGLTLCVYHQIYYDSNQGKWKCPSCEKEHREAIERAVKRRKGGYLLGTQYDTRKSFYGKADVRIEGNRQILKSYNTDVAYIENGKAVVKGTYSQTTLRHIKEFLKQNGFKADSAKQIMKDYAPKLTEEDEQGKYEIPKHLPEMAVNDEQEGGKKRVRKGTNYYHGDRIKQGNWSDKHWEAARKNDNAKIGKKYEDWEKSKYVRWK